MEFAFYHNPLGELWAVLGINILDIGKVRMCYIQFVWHNYYSTHFLICKYLTQIYSKDSGAKINTTF